MDTVIRLLADGTVVPVVLIGVYALLFKVPSGHRYEAYCRILMAGLTAYLVAKFIGLAFQPSLERPFELLGTTPGASYLDNPGFPSDHMLFVTAITLAVWFETRHKLLTSVLVVLSVLVGLGRVSALVHTPLDIIGGIVIACLGAAWYLTALRRESPKHAEKR